MHSLCHHLDEELQKALADALLLMLPTLNNTTTTTSNSSSSTSSNSALQRVGSMGLAPGSVNFSRGSGATAAATGGGGVGVDRRGDLQPYVQEQCLAVMHGLVLGLQQQVEGLGRPAAGLGGAAVVEQVRLSSKIHDVI